jgi:methyl-accepting chemotaxis protein
MFNSISAVLLIILLAVCTFSLVLFNYFYSSMSATLNAKAQTSTSFFSKYDTREEYLQNASYFTASFADKDKLELQFISSYGRIQYSSFGLAAGTTISTPDIQSAISSGKISTWTGRDPETREHIMAVSSPAVLNGHVVGVIRYVTSLQVVDRQIALSIAGAILIGAGIVAMVYFSNLYFIHSIVDPVADLTRAAQRIAAGSYGVKIEKKFDDEIGVLTDTINDMSMKIRQSEKLKSEFLSSVSMSCAPR